MLRLSVLDQSTVVTGRSPDTSIRESLALAKHCEALGYHRYWCAEHHNSESQAGTAPEILISAIAATTSRIRVGTAGVMLPHYSSPEGGGAIPRAGGDRAGAHRSGAGPGAGIGRAHRLCAEPGRRHRGGPFPGAGARPAGLARGRKAGRGPPVPRHPRPAGRADGAGGVDPRQLRLRRAGGGVFRPAVLLRAFHHRRARRGTGAGDLPGGLSAERAPSAPRMPRSASGRWRRRRRRKRRGCSARARCGGWGAIAGVYCALPSPEEAAAYTYSGGERARVERLRARALYGTPDVVGAKLRELAASVWRGGDRHPDHAARAGGAPAVLTLLANECGLSACDATLAT